MVTFVDLAARADALLVQAQERLGTLSAVEATDAARELAVLARACGRILDDVLDARPIAADGARRETPATRAARDVRNRARAAAHNLSRADALNDHPQAPRATRGPTPLLRGAGRYLRTAEEFIQTHRTAGAHPLAGGQPSREMVALVGRWSELIGGIATRMANDVQVPSRPVGTTADTVASLLRRGGASATWVGKHIAARIGSPRETQGRLAIAPRTARPSEDTPADRLDACATALTRLSSDPAVRQGHGSSTAHRVIAGAAAGVCEHAALLARQLAVHAAERPGDAGRSTPDRLAEASRAFADAGTSWRGAVWHCRDIASDTTGMTAGTGYALDAVTQLGRAVTVHDNWAPGMPPAALRGAEPFAADPKQLGRTVRTLRGIGELLAIVADEHAQAARRMQPARRDRSTDTGEASDRPATALADSYAQAASAARRAARLLGDSPTAERPSAPALARASFPAQPTTGDTALAGEPRPPTASATAVAPRTGGRRP